MMDYELNELKREFLAEAGEKVREIERMMSGLGNTESLDRLAYLAHQLKGSGGSYGYQEISNDAAEIEKSVEVLVRNNNSGDANVEASIREHVTSLHGAIERSARELATATA
jgi:HPt (histidine-containing phosphotransfer) domain-containing protein